MIYLNSGNKSTDANIYEKFVKWQFWFTISQVKNMSHDKVLCLSGIKHAQLLKVNRHSRRHLTTSAQFYLSKHSTIFDGHTILECIYVLTELPF